MKRIYSLLVVVLIVFSLSVCMKAMPALGTVNDTNLIFNDGFDALTNWKNKSAGTQNTEKYHKAAPSFKMEGETYIYQEVSVLSDTEYTFSYWAYPETLPAGYENTCMGFKFEYYDASGTHISLDDFGKFVVPDENMQKWSLYETSFITPKGCAKVSVLLRLYKKGGSVYFDDVTLKQKTEPNRLTIDYIDVINYTDETNGKVQLRLNQTAGYAPSASAYMTVKITGTEGTVYESPSLVCNGETLTHTFSTEHMHFVSGETKPYTLTATLYDNGQTYSAKRTIYKYPRPSMLDKDGNAYILGKDKNGSEISRTPITPQIAYHVDIASRSQYGSEPDIDDMPALGVNVVQCMYTTPSGAKSYLDEAAKYGLKVLVPLYEQMLPAGHPLNEENTRDIVLAVRDHAALFGYILMDEPFGQAHRPGTYLEKGYTIIRELDTEHIITFMNDKPPRNMECTQYCDVLMIDPYIWKKENAASFVAEKTADAVACGKPVYSVLQVSVFDAKVPSFSEVRSMWYQAMLAGAKGTGYFAIYDYKWEGSKRISLVKVPEMFNPLCDFSSEMQTARTFLFDPLRRVLSDETDSAGVRKIVWESGNKRYVMLLNTNGRGMKNNETNESLSAALAAMTRTVDIPLENTLPARLLGDETRCSISNGKLSVNMEYCGVYLFCFTEAGFTRNGFLLKTLSEGEAAVQNIVSKKTAVLLYTGGEASPKMLQDIIFSNGAVYELQFNIPASVTQVKTVFWENDFSEILHGEKAISLTK